MNTAIRVTVCGFLVAAVGCQQRMATQPAPRTYEAVPESIFSDGVSARTLSAGTVYRGQPSDAEGKYAGLSAKGRTIKAGDWSGKAAYDEKSVVAPKGAPDDEKNYVDEFPFPITKPDLVRGQERFNIYCAVCHGAAGDGSGKIVERGYLRPPSYHVDPDGKKGDWSTLADQSRNDRGEVGLPQGHSRGFFRYGLKVRLDKVPVGYIYSVITWGYGGMPDHASQIPVDDRWRITAYIRALQLSQGAAVAELPEAAKKKVSEAASGAKSAKAEAAGH